MITAAGILKQKPPVFNVIDADAKVIEALQLMSSVNLSYLVVMKHNVFQGIFSERDYSRNVILRGLHSDTATVKEVMSTSLPAIGSGETIEHCMKLLNSHKTRYLVVFDQQDFIGVVTINDVLREVIKNKAHVFDDEVVNQTVEMQDKVY
jgi:predicted transcriptional regulator